MMGVGVHPRTGKIWLESNNEGVGFGGHAGGDGEHGIMHLTEPGCQNVPIEVFETKAPLLIEDYGLRQNSGGPGEHPGGLGVSRSYQFLAEASALTLIKKTKTRPWGSAGGQNGENCHVILRPGTDQEQTTGMIYEAMAAGDVLVNCSGGGGGWGNPLNRDPEEVLYDVRNEYISLTSAERDYAVVIDPTTLTLDDEATAKLREERRATTATS